MVVLSHVGDNNREVEGGGLTSVACGRQLIIAQTKPETIIS